MGREFRKPPPRRKNQNFALDAPAILTHPQRQSASRSKKAITNTTHSERMSGKGRFFAVVAVGASAGGLEAFTELLRTLPGNTGMAFVFIQHLDPRHHSMLSEILGKHTKMPVVEAANGAKVQPDHIYVIPPNVNMGITQRQIQLTPRAAEPGLHTPIDFFMRSLAEALKERSIGVVLSGTASDGTRGLAAVKEEGGITFAQDERSAKYSGMPHSAVASGCVDFVLPPEKIGQELGRMSRHPYLRETGTAATLTNGQGSKADEMNFDRIFALLRNKAGINFARYKPGTVQRRTLRRMALHKMARVSDYAKYLKTHADETASLCQDLLIPVTSFFRDLEAFEALKTKVFPAVMKDKSARGAIRIWAPGCSTGEETYSLAMVLLEFLGDHASNLEIQLFGTDVNERGIEKARAGVYQERIAQEISPERLRRFFTQVDEGYRISKTVRDLCVFAKQNLADDPPFSQMNLVACRNLLIYLGPDVQKQIMPILHYALRPSGFLMLGNSESAAAFPDLFIPVDKKHKIFVKKPPSGGVHYDFSAQRYPRETSFVYAPHRGTKGAPVDSNQQQEADRIVLNNYAPPGLIIDDSMEILQFRGAVGPYVEPASGKASLNLLKLARKDLVAELRAAINQAKKNHQSVRRRSVELRRNGRTKGVNISVERLGSSLEGAQYLILFERAAPSVASGRTRATLRGPGRTAKGEIARLQQKLAAAEEYLRSVVESNEASDEEYQSANEEIMSANEELQSSNEELETAKEELQSANEELNTVNDELHSRNVDLDRLNGDLSNLLSSTTLPVVMVDRGLRIRLLTAAATKTLKILASDIGRPISDICPDINVPDLNRLIADVIDTLAPKEIEVHDKGNHWYSLQIRPYRTLDDKIDGAIVVLADIDAAKQISEHTKKSEEFMTDILNTVREPLLVLDINLKILYSNAAFLKAFRLDREETDGTFFYRLRDDEWDIPDLRKSLEAVITRGAPVRDFEVEHIFPPLGKKTMLLNARRIEESHSGRAMLLLAIEDITERRRADRSLQESEQRYRTLFDLGPVAVCSCDASGAIRDFNARAVELWGRKPEQGDTGEWLCGSSDAHRPDGGLVPPGQGPMADVLSGKIPLVRDLEADIERPDGSRMTVIVNIRPLRDARGEITGAINCFVDITGRKQAEEERARLAAIVESSDDAMISTTLEGAVTSWNKGAERLFGYSAEEAIGQNVTVIIPPDRLQEEATILESLKRGERVEHLETIRVRKDGTAFDVSLTVSPVRDAEGAVVGASKVARDISEHKRAQQVLERSHAELESLVEQRTIAVRKLSADIIRAQDQERRKISRELHDSVGQYLSHAKVSVELLIKPGMPEKDAERLSHVVGNLEKCLTEARTISHLLHPPMLDAVGLASAAQWYADGFSERSGIRVNLDIAAGLPRLSSETELVLFRVLQESLTNIHRHSKSKSVDIRLQRRAGEISLEVRDYGKGIPPKLLNRFRTTGQGVGVGMNSMRERVSELGGWFEVESSKKGTLIRVAVPQSLARSSVATAAGNPTGDY
jgi:two-component system, chemotaxis family, CheB/CheR fusion protein